MVSLNREDEASGPVVSGFAGNAFRVADRIVPGGLWLTPDDAKDWDAPSVEALEASSLAGLLAISPPPEFLLLGTGDMLKRPPAKFVAALEAQEIGVEAMDSRAAARAWGLLRGEERWIVAALMPLG
ncbi:MTH938/NDUFAF3 family protein [uncultured Parasphingopyxis sp.]|uniref:MTH938/NDUFAF3 family protein n=1 Tax=uncultured Parasphingopyxis sp. TaxID=1547918 RepID=UPI002619496C|nr:MTH938/NDUFAF3 family protein [uncultured Parasphingopyxis sp.]